MKPLPTTEDGPPRQLGRFELVAELASGGMATVYLGRLGGAGGFQRFVAIKRLHSHLANDAEFVDMFLDEARLAARLHHPNVVPILEIGTSDRGYYLVMEYVEGETLARLLNLSHQAGSPVPVNVTVRVFLDVLAGLNAAHELVGDDGRPLEIVHRDVSPQNVLVGVEGAAKITDFGVAHAADRLAHTRTGQLKGKFSYMAPEQAMGYSVDRRADVFAVGTCLWEALACKRLFKGDTEADTLEKVLRGPIPRLRSLVPSLPPALEEVVARSLERERDRRFPSAAHFAEALERAAAASGVLGTQRDVATHVNRVLGARLAQQRDAVRAWVAGMEQRSAGSDLDVGETRGPATRVDVPRASIRPNASLQPLASAATSAPVGAGAAVAAMPVMAEPAPMSVAAQSQSLVSESSHSVAMSGVERSTVSQAPSSRSSAPWFAIGAVIVCVGVFVGVSRAQSLVEGDRKTEVRAAPAGNGAAAAAVAAAQGSAPSAFKVAPPPVPTTPLGTALAVAPPPVPTTPLGAPLAVAPPPVPAAPAAPPVPSTAEPAAPTPHRTVPNYSVSELPTTRRQAAPPPARERDRDRDRDPPRSSRSSRYDDPPPRRESSRSDRGGDDDVDRNPYR